MNRIASKILMITPFQKTQRGNSRTSTRIYEGLSKLGYDIDLISMEEEGYLDQLEEHLGKHKYALIHAFHGGYFSRLMDIVPAGIPRLITMTGTDLNYDLIGKDRAALVLALESSQAVVVFHPHFREQLLGILPSLEGRVHIIPQGVKLPAITPVSRETLGIDPDDIVFLLPSGLRPVKNLDLALDALERVYHLHPQIKLLMVGAVIDPVYGERIYQRIEQLRWILYMDEVRHEEIGGLFELGDVVLNTSWSEGQPQAALEAMSLGKPVILTPVPGNLNIIEEGKHGFYASNAEQIAQRALSLIKDIELRQTLGRNAKQLVKEKYRPQREINQYQALYHHLQIPPPVKLYDPSTSR